jgi:hypothetical protein
LNKPSLSHNVNWWPISSSENLGSLSMFYTQRSTAQHDTAGQGALQQGCRGSSMTDEAPCMILQVPVAHLLIRETDNCISHNSLCMPNSSTTWAIPHTCRCWPTTGPFVPQRRPADATQQHSRGQEHEPPPPPHTHPAPTACC